MTAKTVRKGDTSVTINGKVIDIGLPVQEALAVGDLLILRTDDYDLPSDDPLNGRNFVAFDKNGNEVWRVEPFTHMVKARDGRMVPDSYRSLDLGKDGKLYSFQGFGYVCEIDLKTGKIVDAEYMR